MHQQTSLRDRLAPLLLLLAVTLAIRNAAAQADLSKQCDPEFTKLSECLAYATAKTETPSAKCCDTVSGIKNREPRCLCYIIQQVSKGSTSSIGLQFSRVFKLPTACSIPNANASICPTLLKIRPGSPDNAIFNGSGPIPGTSNFTTPSTGGTGRMHLGSVIIAIASAVASSLV